CLLIFHSFPYTTLFRSYRYDAGFSPEFPGIDEFAGTVIHPQHWPEGFDPTGKRIVVIGSGATAVTLVPSLAADAAHVTMLQRSPDRKSTRLNSRHGSIY